MTYERREETILVPPTGEGPCEYTVTYAPGRPIRSAKFRGVKATVLNDGSLVIYGDVQFDSSGPFMDPQPIVIIPAPQFLECRMTSYRRVTWHAPVPATTRVVDGG